MKVTGFELDRIFRQQHRANHHTTVIWFFHCPQFDTAPMSFTAAAECNQSTKGTPGKSCILRDPISQKQLYDKISDNT